MAALGIGVIVECYLLLILAGVLCCVLVGVGVGYTCVDEERQALPDISKTQIYTDINRQ